jgi:hypothetical protein
MVGLFLVAISHAEPVVEAIKWEESKDLGRYYSVAKSPGIFRHR